MTRMYVRVTDQNGKIRDFDVASHAEAMKIEESFRSIGCQAKTIICYRVDNDWIVESV